MCSMPRVFKRWSEEDLKNAMFAVKEGMTIYEAAKCYAKTNAPGLL